MNTIKNSFSKIKASDKFKDKLSIELQASPINLKSTNKRLYYKSSITAASVLLILIGLISFKLMMNTSEKEASNSDNIAYAPEEESPIGKDYASKNNESANTVEIPYTTDESTIIKSNLAPKTETPITKDTIDENIIPSGSDNISTPPVEITPSNNNVTNENKDINSNIRINSATAFNLVSVPKTQLPKANSAITAKMMPLIVYKGNVYIYTSIEIDSENVKDLVGKKLGTTNGTINEWSTQSDYSTEFASNIGVADVYAVNGYSENFRIMTNIKLQDGKSYPEFYECLNGITVKNGEDIFGKLNLQGNLTKASFRTYSDWNNGIRNFYQINDLNMLDPLFEAINKATPYLPENIEDSLGDYRNDEQYREISLDLKDGCKNITFSILKSGYVYYGYPRVYLKIDKEFTEKFWDNFGIMSIN